MKMQGPQFSMSLVGEEHPVRRMQHSLPNNQDDHPGPPVPSLSRRMNHPAEAEKYGIQAVSQTLKPGMPT